MMRVYAEAKGGRGAKSGAKNSSYKSQFNYAFPNTRGRAIAALRGRG